MTINEKQHFLFIIYKICHNFSGIPCIHCTLKKRASCHSQMMGLLFGPSSDQQRAKSLIDDHLQTQVMKGDVSPVMAKFS